MCAECCYERGHVGWWDGGMQKKTQLVADNETSPHVIIDIQTERFYKQCKFTYDNM
jgi:hypothetical protein